MSHESESLQTRLSRCEKALFGDEDSSAGLSSRMHMTETTTAKIDANLNKLVWLVITGDATDLEQLATHRTYLTTADVAAKEQVSVREVVDMIAQGEITPPPEKSGREYRIAANYRILPQSAEDCGNKH